MVGIINTYKIYPFPMTGSSRPEKKNVCLCNDLRENTIKIDEGKYIDLNCFNYLPDDTLAVYLVGLGGSWSV